MTRAGFRRGEPARPEFAVTEADPAPRGGRGRSRNGEVSTTQNTALALATILAANRDVRVVVTGPRSAEIVNRKNP